MGVSYESKGQAQHFKPHQGLKSGSGELSETHVILFMCFFPSPFCSSFCFISAFPHLPFLPTLPVPLTPPLLSDSLDRQSLDMSRALLDSVTLSSRILMPLFWDMSVLELQFSAHPGLDVHHCSSQLWHWGKRVQGDVLKVGKRRWMSKYPKRCQYLNIYPNILYFTTHTLIRYSS